MAAAPDAKVWEVLPDEEFDRISADIWDRPVEAITQLKTPLIQRKTDGWTLLHDFVACSCSDIQLLRLLDAGIPPNIKDNDNRTPLDCAGFAGKLSLCQLLVKRGAFVDEERSHDYSLLSDAILPKNVEVFKWLLDLYTEDLFSWDIEIFESLMTKMPEGAALYLNKFISDPDNINEDKDIFDFCSIYGDAKDCSTKSALAIAIKYVETKNVLAHPVLRHIVNLKWKKMGFGFYCEVFAYVGLLLSYFATIILRGQDWIVLENGTEYAVMVLRVFAWLCCLYLIVKVDYGELRGERLDYFKSFWNWINFIAYGSILVTIPIEASGKSTSPGHHALLAVINVLLWLNMLQYICIHKTTGILINTMERMVRDVGQFLVLYSIFLLGFSSALHSIMYTDEGYLTYGDTFITVLLMLFGNLTYDPFNSATGWKWIISNLLLFGYLICVVIMLLNVLIAMMSKSIDAIKEAAEAQYWLNNAESIIRIEKSLDESDREKIFKEIEDGINNEKPEEGDKKANEADYQPLLASPNPTIEIGSKNDIEQGIQIDSVSDAKASEIRTTDVASRTQQGLDGQKRDRNRSNKGGDFSSDSAQAIAIENIATQILALKATLEAQILALKATIEETQEQHQDAIMAVIDKLNRVEDSASSEK